ncbi:hypothetical protein MK489_15540 [Myxococcota bacterium]|nr:hypothetical protein [Myxococcota bacterium]
MAEEDPKGDLAEPAQPEDASYEEDDEEVSSPFDNPLFAPLMVAGFVAWFGYDGWFNDDPEMLEHLAFNRYGFMALVLLLGRLLLENYTRVEYLNALLFGVYAIILGGIALLGSPDAWYNDGTLTQMTSRYGAPVFAVLALVSAAREHRRLSKRG